MIVINLWGGPCSGKSTSAAYIFAHLKNRGIRAELVHEAAKRFIYKGASKQLENQVYVFGKQYSHVVDLFNADCEVAISDSPLLQNLIYAQNLPYYAELKALCIKLDQVAPWKDYHFFVKRTKDFDGFGRVQKTVEEAKVYDTNCKNLMKELDKKWDLQATGNPAGQLEMSFAVRSLLKESKKAPAITLPEVVTLKDVSTGIPGTAVLCPPGPTLGFFHPGAPGYNRIVEDQADGSK
jgi:hypothetical protein